MIRFMCECGKQIQGREENAGQQVMCPSCGRPQSIPDSSEDAIQARETAFTPTHGGAEVPSSRPAAHSWHEDAAPVGTSGKAMTSLILGIPSLFCNVLTGIPAVILGILALRDIGRSRGGLSGHGLAIAGIICASVGTLLSCLLLLPALLLPAVQKVREAAARSQSQNNLKQMSLAMHNYHSTYGQFPAAAICDKNGKPLLSWRVAILPFLESSNLYPQFKLDEPWDSPNNKRLLTLMPKTYTCPAIQTPSGETVYQVFVGNGAAFEKTRGLKLPQDFPDGTPNILLIVEASQSVPWTKPDDLSYNPKQPLPPLGASYLNGFNAVSVDGAVHFIPKNTPPQVLHPLIMRNDGQPVAFP